MQLLHFYSSSQFFNTCNTVIDVLNKQPVDYIKCCDYSTGLPIACVILTKKYSFLWSEV
uniref:Uncharacterized protein n=1 Tax=Arundo donax TaxID=35708 RepID=A0A0A8Z8P6_ARUDO